MPKTAEYVEVTDLELINALLNKQAKEIEQLRAMLRTVLSIPAVQDVGTRRAADFPEDANPITDAMEMIA